MSQKTFTLETPDEKKFRIGMNIGVGLLFVVGGILLVPTLTKSINNWIDFGVSAAKLAGFAAITTFVVSTLWLLRKPLYMKWKAWIQKMARTIYRTDLAGILQVIVDNRQVILQTFADSVKKMLGAIGEHEGRIKARAEKMKQNLEAAEWQKKKSQDPKFSAAERQLAADNSSHFASEAARDRESLQKMIADGEKRRKGYEFFDRKLNNLRNDTASVTNEIERLKDEVQMSDTWNEAAQSALKLLGVDATEGIVMEEARKKIAENEAEVISMITDNKLLLEQMEMKQDILTDKGQKLLDEYSNKIDVMAFTEVKSDRTPAKASDFMSNYKGIIN